MITAALILAAWYGGWVHAHLTVAGECKNLGSFYVGKTVYKCTAMENAE